MLPNKYLTRIGLISAVLLTCASMISLPDAFACNDKGNCADAPGHNKYEGAPGPIVGAGLPVLAIGYGVYWLVKRRRKADSKSKQ
jgi:hypothetical protein